MSSVSRPAPSTCEIRTAAPSSIVSALNQRAALYFELIRVRIVVMTMVAAAVGFAVAQMTFTQNTWFNFLITVGGVALSAAAGSVLNQVIEIRTDGLMPRTENRPLPSGRISIGEAVWIGTVCTFSGLALLSLVSTAAAVCGLVTLAAYVCVYTPLKRVSSLCTTFGAIPGAMPPVLGWLGGGGGLNGGALSLFAVLFVWQFPHFLAIAWLYRRHYHAAGLLMLPRGDAGGRRTGMLAAAYGLVFIPVVLLPEMSALAGSGYAWAAIILATVYSAFSMAFAIRRSETNARRLLVASLICLPALLFAMTWDHLRLVGS